MAKPRKKRKKKKVLKQKNRVKASVKKSPKKRVRKLKKSKKEIFKIKPIAKKTTLGYEKKIPLDLKKVGVKAFTKPRKKKGWFAERGKHALAAKGVEIRQKELLKYKYLYSIFIFISLILAILSLIKLDFFSCSIAIVIMFFSILCYRGTVEKKEGKSIIYIITWPFIFALGVASIFRRNFLSFGLAIIAMFLSSLTPTLINKKARKEEIIKIVRELQKSRKPTETDFDKLLVLLNKFGSLKISEIAQAFDIEKKKAEDWARIMEENNFAFLHYPAFSEEELKKK